MSGIVHVHVHVHKGVEIMNQQQPDILIYQTHEIEIAIKWWLIHVSV